jgi:hypothetical protein
MLDEVSGKVKISGNNINQKREWLIRTTIRAIKHSKYKYSTTKINHQTSKKATFNL